MTLFFAAAITCVAIDAWIVYRRPTSAGGAYQYPNGESGYPLPPHGGGLRGFTEAWAFVLDRRKLSFARYQWQRAPRRLIQEVGRIATLLEWSLYMRQPEAARAAFAAAVAASPPSSSNGAPGEQGA